MSEPNSMDKSPTLLNSPLSGQVSPGQLAFLAFALFFLIIPVQRYIVSAWGWPNDLALHAARTLFMLLLGSILLLIPDLRRTCWRLLSIPIPKDKRGEVFFATALNVVASTGVVGGIVLVIWSVGGEPKLARWLNQHLNPGTFSAASFARLFIAVLLAPVIEELIHRGMLYPAWASRWGWFPAALVTSALFAAFHPYMVPQFFASLVLIALLRRTGSLRACIAAHAMFNFIVWDPLIGRFLYPGAGREAGELTYWIPQLLCLAIAFFAVPVYLWLAGKSNRLNLALKPGAQHS